MKTVVARATVGNDMGLRDVTDMLRNDLYRRLLNEVSENIHRLVELQTFPDLLRGGLVYEARLRFMEKGDVMPVRVVEPVGLMQMGATDDVSWY